MVSDDPSAVTPSPAAVAPVARNEAQPSVVPATTAASRGRPNRSAAAAVGLMTAGSSSMRMPAFTIQSGQRRASAS